MSLSSWMMGEDSSCDSDDDSTHCEDCGLVVYFGRDDFRCESCETVYCQTCASTRLRTSITFEEGECGYCEECSGDRCLFCGEDGMDEKDLVLKDINDWKRGSVCRRCRNDMSSCCTCGRDWPLHLLHTCGSVGCGVKLCDDCWTDREKAFDYWDESSCPECAKASNTTVHI